MYYKTVVSLMNDTNKNNSPQNLLKFIWKNLINSFIQYTINFHVQLKAGNTQKLLVSFCRKTLEWDTLSY